MVLRGAVELFVDGGVAHDCLYVFAGLGEGDRLDEFGGIAIGALSYPILDAVGAGVVSGQSVLERSAEFIDHAAEVARAEFKIYRGGVELAWVIALHRSLMGNELACLG